MEEDILVGYNYYWDLITYKSIKVAQLPFRLGWDGCFQGLWIQWSLWLRSTLSQLLLMSEELIHSPIVPRVCWMTPCSPSGCWSLWGSVLQKNQCMMTLLAASNSRRIDMILLPRKDGHTPSHRTMSYVQGDNMAYCADSNNQPSSRSMTLSFEISLPRG